MQNDELLAEVAAWLHGPRETLAASVRSRLKGWVPEYRPAAGSEPVVGAEPLDKAREA